MAREPNLSGDPGISLESDLCSDLDQALAREWLVTNGIGGYASGTIAGAATRRYHALLIAATTPPSVRTAVLGKLEERLMINGVRYDLSANCWNGGAVEPRGCAMLTRFRLERGLPVWRWRIDVAAGCIELEKRIAMVHGTNATLVEYRMLPGSVPCELHLDALVTHRSHHDLAPDANWHPSITRQPGEVAIKLPATPSGESERSLWLHCPGADALAARCGDRDAGDGVWWRDIDLPVERARGYDARDALLHAATFAARLSPGERLTFGASLGTPLPRDPATLLGAERARRQHLVVSAGAGRAPALRQEAVLAADAFVVRRPMSNGRDGWSIIAGYPWFADWSRDTMLAIPGLLLATNRIPAARGALETAARELSAGMLPNRFPDRVGEPVEFNSVDAPLLFVRAVGLVHSAHPDRTWLRSMWPALRSVGEHYLRGTRHGIAVDPHDGLLRAGETGLQLTWMDAKVGSRVITPRMGKPVEVNALWYAALRTMSRIAAHLDEDPTPWATHAERVRGSFQRFWNPAEECLFDVIDVMDVMDGPTQSSPDAPLGVDASIRPNQILAAGLEDTPLDPSAIRAVVARVGSELFLPLALRTLNPTDPRYRGRCQGTVEARDDAYHQGTAWPWLLPFFVRAWRRAGGSDDMPEAILDAWTAHLFDAGIGSISEIVDGDAPHEPRGCPAQAWSVAAYLELLRDGDAVQRPLADRLAEVRS